MMIFPESVTSQPFVNEMPVFLQALYSRFLAQISSLTMLLPAFQLTLSLCFKSVQAAGGKFQSMRGRRYVSTSCKAASCPRQYTALTKLDVWVAYKVCTTSYVHVYDLKVQI